MSFPKKVPDQAWRTLGPKKKPFGYDAALVRMGSHKALAAALINGGYRYWVRNA
jgi:hypothetical protein